MSAFLDAVLTGQSVDRRQRVWIRRHLDLRNKPLLQGRMDAIVAAGRCDDGELTRLRERASCELSMGEKRRFIYGLAQLFQSKGSLSAGEYEKVLASAEALGVSDVEADSMLRSVYSINDSFIAIMGVLALGAILYLTRSVIVPMVVAIFITMIVYKVESLITTRLAQRRLRWLTKLVATAVVLGVFFGLVTAAIAAGAQIVEHVPHYQAQLIETVHDSPRLQHTLTWLHAHGVVMQPDQLPIGAMIGAVASAIASL
ncbi:MAG: AI-2E family transporter, partial [Polyangiales bacterium]